MVYKTSFLPWLPRILTRVWKEELSNSPNRLYTSLQLQVAVLVLVRDELWLVGIRETELAPGREVGTGSL